MLDKRIKFDEKYIDEKNATITFYFIAPKDILGDKYPEAEHAEISVECPVEYLGAREASVMLSPTKYIKEEDAYLDYDWFDFTLPYEEVEELIDLAKRSLVGVFVEDGQVRVGCLDTSIVLTDEEAEEIYCYVDRQNRIADALNQFFDFVGVDNAEALKDKSLEEVKNFKKKYGVYPEKVCDKTSKYYLLEVFADNFLENHDCSQDENSQFQEVIRDALETAFLE